MNTFICKAFMEGKCNQQNCNLIHNNQLCKFLYFRGDCKKGDLCRYSHQGMTDLKENHVNQRTDNQQTNNQRTDSQQKYNQRKDNQRTDNLRNVRKKKKNTESFVPSHRPSDMRILTSLNLDKFDSEISSRDVVLIQGLFKNQTNLYDRLLQEMKDTGLDQNRLWKSWHGDSHLIADDKMSWKRDCPTFNLVINKIKTYFGMDVKATRFNWYQNSNEWKPFHHDAAAVKKDKAKTQNFTVGVSFGATREVAFEHAAHKNSEQRTVVEFPLVDGTVYAFSRDVNVEWKHGIPQIKPGSRRQTDQGRISIIAWGWLDGME